MKRTLRLLLAGIILTLLVIAAVPVAAAGDGSISGTVYNGSDNATPLAGLSITLNVFDDMTAAAEFQTDTDADGNFEFTGLDTDTAFSYRLSTEYADLPYDSGFLQFLEVETTIPGDIWVYETTTDDSAVRLAMAHVIIAAGEGYLSVTEYHIFVNDSELAYIGPPDGSGEVLRFALPAGASGLDFSEGLTNVRMLSGGGGFADAAPLWPGMREVVFTYVLPIADGQNQLTFKFYHPVTALNLLVEDTGLSVSTALTAGEPLAMESRQFSSFSGQNIPAGEEIALTLKSGGGASDIGAWVWVLVTLLVGAVGVFIWYRLRGSAPAAAQSDASDESRDLLLTLARLDDDYEAGKIAEAAYTEQRAAIKSQLADLLRRDGSGETP